MTLPSLRRLIASLGGVGLLLACSRGAAQTGPLADSLFREARAALKAGDLATACPKFAQSYSLDPSIGTLLNLALCEEQRGRLATARLRFQEILDSAPAQDPRLGPARQHIEALRSRIPHLVLRSKTPVSSHLALRLDDEPLPSATLGQEMPLDPGPHQIVAADGERTSRLSVVLQEGQRLEKELEWPTTNTPPTMASVSAAPPPSAPITPETRLPALIPAPPPPRTAGWVLVGTGGAALVLATVAEVFTSQQRSLVNAHCPSPGCDPVGLEASKTGKRWLWTANAAFAVGAIEVGLGAWLVLRAEPQQRTFLLTGSFP